MQAAYYYTLTGCRKERARAIWWQVVSNVWEQLATGTLSIYVVEEAFSALADHAGFMSTSLFLLEV